MNNGFVRLIDCMPSNHGDGDRAIVQAARVSYGDGTKTTSTDRGLIRYLLRHWHTTPFEMVEFKFHIKMPIFVARQHLRHRTASINEISGRYSKMPEEYWIPDSLRSQSGTNKQGSGEDITLSTDSQEKSCTEAFNVYTDLIERGCARELARCHLPLNTYTEFYWKINLHNLLHYLRLRMDDHAQKEIRDYAEEMFRLVEPYVPVTMEAFRDYRLNSINFHWSRN